MPRPDRKAVEVGLILVTVALIVIAISWDKINQANYRARVTTERALLRKDVNELTNTIQVLVKAKVCPQ